MCDMWKTGSSLEGSVGNFTRTSLRKTGWRESKHQCSSGTLAISRNLTRIFKYTVFLEGKLKLTQEEQPDRDHHKKLQQWTKKKLRCKPHAVLLASELCERDRTVSRDVVWNWKSCLHGAIFQVPCLNAAPILNFISPAPKYWVRWPVSMCCVDTETEVLKNLAHAIVWIPKQMCILQKTAQATGDLNNQVLKRHENTAPSTFFRRSSTFLWVRELPQA